MGREGARGGYGGGTEGERWGSDALAGGLQCAILAQKPPLASNVNQQLLSKTSHLAPDRTYDPLGNGLSHQFVGQRPLKK